MRRYPIMAPEGGDSGAGGAAPASAAPAPAEPAKPAEKPKLVIKRAEARPVTPAPAEPAKPAPAPDDSKSTASAELEAIRAEREALRRETEAAREWREQGLSVERRKFVRELGLAVDFSDEHLDQLIPKSDPSTAAGKAELRKWREGPGARYFKPPTTAPVVTREEKLKAIVGEKHPTRRLFGQRHANMMLGE